MAEAIGIVSGVAGLLSFAMKVTELSYGYISDIRSAQRTQKQYLRELSALTEVLLRTEEALQDFEEDASTSKSTFALSEAILDCLHQLKSLLAELEKPSPSIFWPLKEKSLKKYVEDLHRFRGIFSDFLTAQTLVTASATHREVSRLGQHQDQSELLKWLGISKQTSRTVEIPHPGASAWFLRLQEFQDWSAGIGPPILWCHGPPGVGKSVLAAAAVDRLSLSDSTCLLAYFCNYPNRREQSKDEIWRAFLSQAISLGHLATMEALKRLRDRTANSRTATSTNLSDALLTVCSTLSVTVVMDGPDELENPKDFKAILAPFIKASCRILVTSRDIPEIRTILNAAVVVEVEADTDELSAYVARQFQESDLEHILEKHPDLVKDIVSKADKIFLILRLLVDNLIDMTTIKQMRKAIQAYSSYLDQAFESSLERIMAQSKSQRTLALRVIGWITSAERSLQMHEIIHGLATQEESDEIDDEDFIAPKTIVKVCGGLVIFNSHDGTLSMVHSTIHTWFQNRNGIEHHEDLARTCLRYLTLRPLASGAAKSVEELDRRLGDMHFLAYACRHWRKHIVNSQVGTQVKDHIHKLISHPGYRSAAFQATHYHPNIKDQGIRSMTFESIPTNHTILHMASYWNLADKLVPLLETENVNAVDSQNWGPLHWACHGQSPDAARVLLSNGALVNAKDSVGWTPLFWAALHGDETLVKILLDHGSEVWVRDKHGWTALRWAAARLQTQVVKLLVVHHANTMKNVDKSPRKLLKGMGLEECLRVHENSVAQEHLLNELITGGESESITNMETLLETLEDAPVDIRALWKPGYFDAPVGNAWRTMSKFEVMRGTHFYISDTTGSSILGTPATLQSGLLHAAIRDGNLLAFNLLIELGVDVNAPAPRSPLHVAVFRKDTRFAETLLLNGADIEDTDYHNLTPLQQAVLNGFENVTKFLLSKGARVNACNANEDTSGPRKTLYRTISVPRNASASNLTPLMLATGLRQPSDDPDLPARMVRLLIDAGADVHMTSRRKDGFAVIHYAARSRDPSILQMVIDAGADPKTRDCFGRTTLHHLILGHNREHADATTRCFMILKEECGTEYLSVSARWNSLVKQSSGIWSNKDIVHSPMSLSIHQEEWGLFHMLLQFGARFETNIPLESMLEAALSASKLEVVDILVEHGVTVEDVSWISPWLSRVEGLQSGNMTAEQAAKLVNILTKLISAGLDINALDHGQSLLHIAVSKGGPLELIVELLKLGGDPTIPSITGLDSFLLGLVGQHHGVLKVLLDHIRVYPTNCHWTSHIEDIDTHESEISAVLCAALAKSGELDTICEPPTLLSRAAESGQESLVRQLLQLGADPGQRDKDGQQAIHRAAAGGYVTIVESLLHVGVDVLVFDNSQRTAAHLAAENGHAETLELLLSQGGDLNARDANGWQPLHYAALKGHVSASKVLLDNGASVQAKTFKYARHLEYYRPSRLWMDRAWAGTPLHLAAMAGSKEIVSMIIQKGSVDINATAHDSEKQPVPGSGPSALHIALSTSHFYGSEDSFLRKERLEIAQLLIENGADVTGVANHLDLQDLGNFKGFSELWDKIRVGITSE